MDKGFNMELEFTFKQLGKLQQEALVEYATQYPGPMRVANDPYRSITDGFAVKFEPACGSVDGDSATRILFAGFICDCMYLFH